MLSLNNTAKKYYNEAEAARELRISLDTLHEILDKHVFTGENPRPDEIELTYSDLLLLSVWAKPEPNHNILQMPRRR
jgi:hypothetical protein